MAEFYLAITLTTHGKYEEALSILEKIIEEDAISPSITAFAAYNAAKLGDRGKAFEYLSHLLEQSSDAYVSPTFIGFAYLGLEDYEKALDWVYKGYELKDDWLRVIKAGQNFDPIRENPRFQEILEKIGLAD